MAESQEAPMIEIRRSLRIVLILVLGASIAIAAAGEASSDLNRLAAKDVHVTLAFRSATVASVFRSLEKVTGLEIALDSSVSPDRKIDVDIKDVPLKQALESLAEQQGWRYEVNGPDHLTVAMPRAGS